MLNNECSRIKFIPPLLIYLLFNLLSQHALKHTYMLNENVLSLTALVTSLDECLLSWIQTILRLLPTADPYYKRPITIVAFGLEWAISVFFFQWCSTYKIKHFIFIWELCLFTFVWAILKRALTFSCFSHSLLKLIVMPTSYTLLKNIHFIDLLLDIWWFLRHYFITFHFEFWLEFRHFWKWSSDCWMACIAPVRGNEYLPPAQPLSSNLISSFIGFHLKHR